MVNLKKFSNFFLNKIDELGESLSFLHQNEMKIVIVIGDRNGTKLDLDILKVKSIIPFFDFFHIS